MIARAIDIEILLRQAFRKFVFRSERTTPDRPT
jgi:hypothetical protein